MFKARFVNDGHQVYSEVHLVGANLLEGEALYWVVVIVLYMLNVMIG